MPTFTRSVSKLDAEDADVLTAVAYNAHWRVTCVEDATIGVYGTQALGEPDPNAFTAFADVTEDQAIAWLGEEFWSEIEGRLSARYAEKQASTKISKEF